MKSLHKHRVVKDESTDIFWCWRRVVSMLVLVIFSSNIFSPVFASYEPTDKKVNHSNGAIKAGANKIEDNPEGDVSSRKIPHDLNDRNLRSFAVKFKDENDRGGKYFSSKYSAPKSRFFSPENIYQPYLEMGGIKYFNQRLDVAGMYDLFIPLLQTDDKLFFTDLRIFNRRGGSFEGNAHLGFRKLFRSAKQMFGVYAAFDRKRTLYKNWSLIIIQDNSPYFFQALQ